MGRSATVALFVWAISHSRWSYYSTMVYYSYVKRTGERDLNMSHSINYAVYERNVSRKAVLAEIQEEVMHEDWQQGGWYPDGQLKWHEDHVFETQEDAERFLERYEGKYDDHAVLFRNTDRISVKKSAEETKLEERLNRLKAELSAIEGGAAISNRKSAFIGCPSCGSKLERVGLYRKFGNVCPICSTDLRSKTDRNRIAAKKKGIRETEKRLEQKRYEMKVKASRSAPICWLVKYEYHV